MKDKLVDPGTFKASADPRFDLSLVTSKDQVLAKKTAGSHKLPIRTEKDEEEESDMNLKKKKKKARQQQDQTPTSGGQPSVGTQNSHGSAVVSSSALTSKKASSAGIALSSALKAELSGGSSKKRTTTYVRTSDDEEEELGKLAQDTVMPGSKVKKVKGPAPISDEILEAARKLSKNQRRKMESIEKRKELEVKAAGYLGIIAQHAISDKQRDLLVSGKQVGQSYSVKQMLRKLLKKYQAGMQLSPAELELLFPSSGQSVAYALEGEEPVIALLKTKASDALGEEEEEGDEGEGEGDTLVSLHAFAPPTLPADATAAAAREREREKEKEKAKARRKNKATATQEKGEDKEGVNKPQVAQESESEFVSFGANLMAQLSALKKSGALPIQKKMEEEDEDKAVPQLVPVAAEMEAEVEYKTLVQTLRGTSAGTDNVIYSSKSLVLPTMDGKDAARLLSGKVGSSGNQVPAPKVSNLRRIAIKRSDEIQQQRLRLPICAMEQEIVEAIIEDTSHLSLKGAGAEFKEAYSDTPKYAPRPVPGSNGTDVVILCGETGSGKSTQVPQFLHEYGLTREGMVGITQPRRVAAVSTAERVAVECGEPIIDLGGGKHKPGVVGYQIRHDSATVSDNTKIKFMTDGILLQEIMADFLLRKYSVIILDEAHERNINTDMLLGLLSRCLPIRRAQSLVEHEVWNKLPEAERQAYALPIRPLKLVIMSATLRVGDFVTPRLFPSPPPVLKVEARQYAVTNHFAKRTELDQYLPAAHKKVCQIHRKLPAGGILVFLTGKREILHFIAKLQNSLGPKKNSKKRKGVGAKDAKGINSDNVDTLEKDAAGLSMHEDYETAFGGLDADEAGGDSNEDEAYENDYDSDSISGSSDSESDFESDHEDKSSEKSMKKYPSSVTSTTYATPEAATEEEKIRAQMLRKALGLSDESAIGASNSANAASSSATSETTAPGSEAKGEDDDEANRPLHVHILPLYAMMPAEHQSRVFKDPPAGARLIVVATNVAETSITIPNIRYVIDTGRQKVKTRNLSSGVSKFEVAWVSQAQAEQRKGRAGRTGPGHVYRLYSANFFDQHMAQFGEPEIVSTPLEGLLLQMKSIGVTDISSFPFPTRPPEASMTAAVNTLMHIGAITRSITAKSDRPAHMKWLMSGSEEAQPEEIITNLGKLLSHLPISPRLGKILVFAHRSGDHSLFMHALSLIAVLSETSPFNKGNTAAAEAQTDDGSDSGELDSDEEAEKIAKEKAEVDAALWHHASGDSLARLRTLGAFAYVLSRAAGSGAAAVQKILNQEAAHKRKEEREESQPQDKKQKTKVVLSPSSSSSTAGAGAGAGAEKKEEFVFSSLATRRSFFNQLTNSSVSEFCSEHALNSVVLERSLELRAQLVERCFLVLGAPRVGSQHGDNEDVDLTPSSLYVSVKHRAVHASARQLARLPPPTASEEAALRQLLVMGFCDHIAKKVPVGMIQQGSRRKRLTAYISANPAVAGALYMHPQSALYSSDPTAQLPEYVVYDNLVQNERGDQVYMATLSVINPAWLANVLGPAHDSAGQLLCPACPLLQTSAPLASPVPFYDRSLDEIVCYVVPSFGNSKWELAPQQQPMYLCISEDNKSNEKESTPTGFRKAEAACRWFARSLLEGKVVLGSSASGSSSSDIFNTARCREPPVAITDMRPVPRVSNLLRQLAADGIRNKLTLESKIKERRELQESYLLEELTAFMHVDGRKEFKKKWLRLCAAL